MWVAVCKSSPLDDCIVKDSNEGRLWLIITGWESKRPARLWRPVKPWSEQWGIDISDASFPASYVTVLSCQCFKRHGRGPYVRGQTSFWLGHLVQVMPWDCNLTLWLCGNLCKCVCCEHTKRYKKCLSSWTMTFWRFRKEIATTIVLLWRNTVAHTLLGPIER